MKTMTDLIIWFRKNYPDLVQEMKNSDHGYNNEDSNPYHVEGDVWTHTMMVCKAAENLDIVGKITALLHDIGKPASRVVKEDKEKVVFYNHEGVSAFMAIPILNKMIEDNMIDTDDAIDITRLISLHGESWKLKPSQLMSLFNINEWYLFERLIQQIKCDEEGRFVNSTAHSLDESLFTREQFDVYTSKEQCFKSDSPEIRVLIGLPGCGKSTYTQEILKQKDFRVISRDSMMLRFAEHNGHTGTYSQIWKSLSEEDHETIDKLVQENFDQALRNKEDIIIDMTNMSRKSRRKWLSPAKQKGYISNAIVFLTDVEVCASRRYENSGKHISDGVYKMMMGNFMMPGYDEFDNIEII